MPECAGINMNLEVFSLVFKALSDKTRLRTISLLVRSGKDLCVCEIADSLGEPQYKISKHLKELKFAGLAEEKKEGKWVNYSLATADDRFKKFIFKAIASIPEEITASDEKRLAARLSLRENGQCVVGLQNEKWEAILRHIEKERRI
jgi:ArsR family transcriptional regulator